MENRPPKMTPEEAIYDVRERMVRIETVLTGVPNTDDKGLVGTVKDTTKKVGKLEIRFWILVAFLVGSGVLNGFAIMELIKYAH